MMGGVCEDCRYWSQMVAQAGGGTENPTGAPESICLSGTDSKAGRYTVREATCEAFAKNSHGAVDEPPDYGETARREYEREAAMRHPNGSPMFAPDGTMLDEVGNRSIFDDVDD